MGRVPRYIIITRTRDKGYLTRVPFVNPTTQLIGDKALIDWPQHMCACSRAIVCQATGTRNVGTVLPRVFVCQNVCIYARVIRHMLLYKLKYQAQVLIAVKTSDDQLNFY